MLPKSIEKSVAENGAAEGEFFFAGLSAQARALVALGTLARDGFQIATMVGERGVGKTTVCSRFAAGCGSKLIVACVVTPLTASELRRRLLRAFGLTGAEHLGQRPLESFFGFLLDQRLQNRKVVLVLDDAHKLSGEVINTLRVLAHLKLDDDRLLHVVLVGEPHLNEVLRAGEFDALRPEIGLRIEIGSVSREESDAFVRAALAEDAETAHLTVTDDGLSLLYRYSAGNLSGLRLLLDLAAAHTLARGGALDAPSVWEAIQTPDWVRHRDREGGAAEGLAEVPEDLSSRPCVAVFHGTSRLAQIEIRRKAVVFGRAPSCEIRTDDGSVSRTHARLSFTEEGVLLRDLHSQNGTFVNGRRIDEVPLRDGDVIRLGKISALFFYRTIGGPALPAPLGYSADELAEDQRLEAQLEELFIAQATTETRSTVVPLRPRQLPLPEGGGDDVALVDEAMAPDACVEADGAELGEAGGERAAVPDTAEAPADDIALVDDVAQISGLAAEPEPGARVLAEPVAVGEPANGVEVAAEAAAKDVAVEAEDGVGRDWLSESQGDYAMEIELPAGLKFEAPVSEIIAAPAPEPVPEVAEPVFDGAPEVAPAARVAALQPADEPSVREHRESEPTGIFSVAEARFVYRIDKPFFTIGREAENDLRIDSAAVSRAHALVVYDSGALWVEDLDSANGTFVNSERITKKSLRDGDFLRIGDRMFRYVAPVDGEQSGELGELHSVGLIGWTSAPTVKTVPQLGEPRAPEVTDAPPQSADEAGTVAEAPKAVDDGSMPDASRLAPVPAPTEAGPPAQTPTFGLRAAIWVAVGVALSALYFTATREERNEARPVVAEKPTPTVRGLPDTTASPPSPPATAASPEVVRESSAPAPAVPTQSSVAGRESAERSPAPAVEATSPAPSAAQVETRPADVASPEEAVGIAALLGEGARAGAAVTPEDGPEPKVAPKADRREAIDRLLAQGQRQLAANRLAAPPRDNAIDTYRRVLKLDPSNAEAKRGLKKIADLYAQTASKQKERGQLSASLASIELGLKADRSSAELNALRAEVQRLARAEKARERVAAGTASPTEPTPEQPPVKVTVAKEKPGGAAEPPAADLPVFVDQPAPASTTASATATPEPRPAPTAPKAATPPVAANDETAVARPPAQRVEPPTARKPDTLPTSVAKAESPTPSGPAPGAEKQARAAAPIPPADPQRAKAAEQLQRQVQNMQVQRLVSQARERHDVEDYDGSLELIEQGLAIEPRNLELLSMRDQVLQRKASADQRAADKTVSAIVNGLIAQAKQRRADGQLGESLKLIESALAIQPRNRELQQLKALVQKDING